MASSPLRLFVYGTLKRGQRSHSRFCATAISVEPATVVGRLFQLTAGYPILVLPPGSTVAIGTRDPARDLDLQRQTNAANSKVTTSEATVLSNLDDGDWETIEGQLVAFDEADDVLPRLDEFEDFRPGSADTSYVRVLVRLASHPMVYAWTYTAPLMQLPAGASRVHHRWP